MATAAAVATRRTTIAMKWLMAVTGIVMFGYLVGHMAGNLQIFMGPAKINGYAHFLHTTPSLLWGTRVLLVASVVLHIGSAWWLTRANQAARPVRYQVYKPRASTYASRTMVWSGPIILLFVIYHLLHLTFGVAHQDFRGFEDVYHNLVTAFRVPIVSIAYIVALAALAFHLHHGLWAMFNSLGVSHPRYEAFKRSFATAFTLLIAIGFVVVPIAVMVGAVK